MMPEDSKALRNSSTTGPKVESSHVKLDATVRNALEKHGGRADLCQSLKEEIPRAREHGTAHVVEKILQEKKEDKHTHMTLNLTKKNEITGRKEEKILNDQRHETNKKQETLKKDDRAKSSTKESRRSHTEKSTTGTKGEDPTKNIKGGPDRASSHQRVRSNSGNPPNQERADNLQERHGKQAASHNSSRKHESSHGSKVTTSTHRERTSTHGGKRTHSTDHYKKQDSTSIHAQRSSEWKEPDRKRIALMNSNDTIQARPEQPQPMQPINSGTVGNENKPKKNQNDKMDRHKESHGDKSTKDDKSTHDRSKNQLTIKKASSSSTKKSESDAKKSREHCRDAQKEVRSSETDSKRDQKERGEVKSHQSVEGKQLSQCTEADKKDPSRKVETSTTEKKSVSSHRSSHKHQSSETHKEASGSRHKAERHSTTGTKSQRSSGNDKRSERPATRSSPDSESRKAPISNRSPRENREKANKRDRSTDDLPKREPSATDKKSKTVEKKRSEPKSKKLSKERDHHKSAADSKSLQPRKESSSAKLGADNHKTKSSTMRDTKSHVLKEECKKVESAKQAISKRNASDVHHVEQKGKASNKDVENQKTSSGSSVEKKANANCDGKETVQSKEKPKAELKRQLPKSERSHDSHSKVRKSTNDKSAEKSSTCKKHEEHKTKKQSDAKSIKRPHASASASATVQNENDTKQIQLGESRGKKHKEVSNSIDSASVQKKAKMSIAGNRKTEKCEQIFDFVKAQKVVRAPTQQDKSVNQKNSSSNASKAHSSKKKKSSRKTSDDPRKELDAGSEICTKVSASTKLPENDNDKMSAAADLGQGDITMDILELCGIQPLEGSVPISELKVNVEEDKSVPTEGGIAQKMDDDTGPTYLPQQAEAPSVVIDLMDMSDFVIFELDEGKIELGNLEEPSKVQPTAGEDEEREQKLEENRNVEEQQDKIWNCDLPPDIFADSVNNQSETFDQFMERNFPGTTTTINLNQDVVEDVEQRKDIGYSEQRELGISPSYPDSIYQETDQTNVGDQICVPAVGDNFLNEVLQTFEIPQNKEESIYPNNTEMQSNEGSLLSYQVEPSFGVDLFAKDTLQMFDTNFLNSLEYNDEEMKENHMAGPTEILMGTTDVIQQITIEEDLTVSEHFGEITGEHGFEDSWKMMSDNTFVVDPGVLSILEDFTNGRSGENRNDEEIPTIRNEPDPEAEDTTDILADLQLDGFSVVDMPMDRNSRDEREYVFKIQEDDINSASVCHIQHNELTEEVFQASLEERRGENPKQGTTEELEKCDQSKNIESNGSLYSTPTNCYLEMAQETPESQYLQIGHNAENGLCSSISPMSYVDFEQYSMESEGKSLDAQECIINTIETNNSKQANENNNIGGQKTEEEAPLNTVEQQPNDISEPNLGLAWVWDVANEISEQLSTNLDQTKYENPKLKKVENIPRELKPNPQNNKLEKNTEDNTHFIAEYTPVEINSLSLAETSTELNNLTQNDFGISELDFEFLLDSNDTEINLNTSMTKTINALKEQGSSILNDKLSKHEDKLVKQSPNVAEHLILPESSHQNETCQFTKNKELTQLKKGNNVETVDFSLANPGKQPTPAMQLIFDCFGDLESCFERSLEGSRGKVRDMRLQCDPRNILYDNSIDTSEFDFCEQYEPRQQQEEQYTKSTVEHSPKEHGIIIGGPDRSSLESIDERPLKKPKTDSKSVDTSPVQCNSNKASMEDMMQTKDQTLGKPEARHKIEETEKEGGWFLESMHCEMKPAESVPSSRGQKGVVDPLEAFIIESQNTSVKQLKRKSVDKSDEIEQMEIFDSLHEKKRKLDANERPKLAIDKCLGNGKKQIKDINMEYASKPASSQNETLEKEGKRTEMTLNKILTQTEFCDNLSGHKTLEGELRPLVSRAAVVSTPKPIMEDITKPQARATLESLYSSSKKNGAPNNILYQNTQDSKLNYSYVVRQRFLDAHGKTKDSNSNASGSLAEAIKKFSAADIAPTKFPAPQTSIQKEPTKQQIPTDSGIPNTQSSRDYSNTYQGVYSKRVKLLSDQTESIPVVPVDTMENSAQGSDVPSTIISPKSKSKQGPQATAKNGESTSAQASVDCVEVKAKPDVRDRYGNDTRTSSRHRPPINRRTNIVRTQKFLSVAQKILMPSKDAATKLAAQRIMNALNACPIGKNSSKRCSETIPAESIEAQSKEAAVSSRILVALEKKGVEANRILRTFKEDLTTLSRMQSLQTNANSMSSSEPYLVEDINDIFNARLVRKQILSGKVIRLPPRRGINQIQPHLADDDEMDLEEIGVPDKFQIYWPSIFNEKQCTGLKHPCDVLEMATLLSIEIPKITYTPALKAKDPLRVSDLQVEAMIYACQASEQLLASGQRAGFLLGDGPGVGKSRTLAAIIYENFRQGRKRSLWVSMAEFQYLEIERELSDIGASPYVKVTAMSHFNYNYIGVSEAEDDVYKKGIICTTYAELTHESPEPGSKFRTHVSQLAHWLGKNGVIVFDDCHKALRMNLANSDRFINTCSAVLKLQQLLPFARVVYVSDASICEPRDMVFMTRLGLWGRGTPFADFPDFVQAMEKLGTGAMELVAVDLKLRGMFISRHLSMHNASYRIEEAPMSRDFRNFYNYSADLWAKIHEQLLKAFRRLSIDVRIQERISRKFWNAHELYFKNLSIASKLTHLESIIDGAKQKGQAVVIGVLSSSEYDNYQYPTQQQGELRNFLSTAKDILQSFIEWYFPVPSSPGSNKLPISRAFELPTLTAEHIDTKPALFSSKPSTSEESDDIEQGVDGAENRRRMGDKLSQQQMLTELLRNMQTEAVVEDFSYTLDSINPQAGPISEDEVKHWVDVREKFLQKIQKISHLMPPNALDKIIADLGGSSAVAEVTNRCGRVLKINREIYKYEQRCETLANVHLINYAERVSFLEDKKGVIIVSENAACSVSLQSIPSVPNKKPRVYVSLELPWGADRAIQQFGCTKRSNQANEPEFVMLVTDIGTELHQANIVSLKLKNLGATDMNPPFGDPYGRDQSLFVVNNSVGRSALDSVLQQIAGNKPLEAEHLPEFYQGDFVVDCCKALAGVGMLDAGRNTTGQRTYVVNSNSTDIPTFLKRIIGCRIEVQKALFKFFLNKMYALMMQIKQTRLLNMGIMDLDVHGSVITVTKLVTFKRSNGWGSANVELHTVEVERGVTFDAAMMKFKKKVRQPHEGFYILLKKRNKNNCAILCINSETDEEPTEAPTDPSKINVVVIRPNTGTQLRTELLSSLLGRYVKASPKAAQSFWKLQYTKSVSDCSHIYWGCKCPYGTSCGLGLRVRTYHILSGSVLSIWKRVALLVETNGEQMQIARVKTSSNNRIVGIVVPEFAYRQVMADLSSDAKVETMDFTIA